MQFTRRMWIAAACVLSLFAGSAVQAQQTKLLPADTEMVTTFNLQQILKSEVLKQNKELVDLVKAKINEGLDDKGVSKWLKKAEFDLFKDLSSISIAVPGGRNPEEVFIVLEGNFDAEKIEAAALDASKEAGGGLKVIKLGGIKAFEIAPKEEKTIYVGVIGKKTMVICTTKDDFIGAVARSKAAKTEFKSATFKGLMQTINSKQSISFAATSSVAQKLAEKAPEGAPQAKQAIDALKQLDGFSAAVTIEKNIDFQFGVNTKDKDTASDYANKGNIGLGLAKLQLAKAAENDAKMKQALDIVNSIKISAKGPNLVVSGQITFETLGELLKLIPKQ